MKKSQLAIAGAFVFAIGSAFVTKAAENRPYTAGYVQVGTACNPSFSQCKLNGTVFCSESILHYAAPAISPATGCINPLQQKD